MVKYLVDSSSLVSLARYYDPFDKEERLMNFVRHNFEKNNWLLHDSVRNEIKKVAERIVVTTYPFLKNKIKPLKMVTEITSTQHQNIDNYWAIHLRKEKLELRSKDDYLREKNEEIKRADFQLILTAMKYRNTYTIVTEETKAFNDGKLFKKSR